MRSVVPILSKALLLLAAFASPMQSFYGTPVLCHLLESQGDEQENASHPEIQATACKCCLTKSNATRCAPRRSSFQGSPSNAPARPCPATCWCKQRPQPQSEPPQPEEEPDVSGSRELVECDGTRSDTASRGCFLLRNSSRLPVASSADTCSQLCRYLA